MSQFSGISFKSEKRVRLPNPRRKLFIMVSSAVLIVSGCGYGLHIYHLLNPGRQMAAKPVVQPAKTSAKGSTAATNPPSTAGQTELAGNSSATNSFEAAANTGNLVEAGPAPEQIAPVSFGESLMSVLTPSAKAESIQPAFQPARTLPQATTMAAKRIPLKTQTHTAASKAAPSLTDEQQRSHAAQAGFWEVMDNAVKNPDLYGFKVDDRLQNAKLGNAIPVYMITEQDRRNYQAGQPLKPLLKPTQEWFYPITLGERVCFMVQIRYDGHEYVIDRGSRALAMVYGKIQQNWPASEGFHPQLVANPHLPTYYFTIPELPTPNITDTSEMFGHNPSLSPAAVILASWY